MTECPRLETLKAAAEWVTALTALGAGIWAAWTYHKSVKLERAKWMKGLYEKFYESDQLKKVRNQLDSGDQTAIKRLTQDEPSDFTDYLNFFEFLSYLVESDQVTMNEVGGLFNYYLANLAKDQDVRKYIGDPANGFEKLNRLLIRAPR